MKKLLLTAAALAASAGTGLAQGEFWLENASSWGGLAIDRAGNYYAGTFGVEVWELNGTPDPALFNAINALDNTPLSQGGGGVAAYALMLADGFKLEATRVGQTTEAGSPGVFYV